MTYSVYALKQFMQLGPAIVQVQCKSAYIHFLCGQITYKMSYISNSTENASYIKTTLKANWTGRMSRQVMCYLFIRPPDIVGLCRRTNFYQCFFFFLSFFLSFFVSYSRKSLNETQPYPATWSEVNIIWKCMSEIWGIPSPYKSGAQKPPFFKDLATSPQL